VRARRLAEWKPYARRTISFTLLFMASALALLMFSRRAARIPGRCLRIVRPSLTNGFRRLRERRASSRRSARRPPRW
jgi:hypothetical protein